MKAQITKIKNFEGYWLSCEHCGREIKHGFAINGNGCYGSECVVNLVTEKTIISVRKQMKDIMRRAKNFANGMAITPEYYVKTASLYGMTLEQYEIEYINGNI